jgi:hypothetical protein
MLFYTKVKLVAAGIVLFALLLIPAPLLPPHRLAEAVQSLAGISWKAAYLVSAILLPVVFYGAIGLMGAFVVRPARTIQGRLVQIVVLPLGIIAVALVVRSAKGGYFPVLANILIPMAACLAGVLLGIGVVYRRGKIALLVVAAIIGAALWGLLGGTSAKLSRDTEAHLRRLVASCSSMPPGDMRLGALLQTAFAPLTADSIQRDAIEHNRAAILALGIAVGHERIARYIGIEDKSLLSQAILLRNGTNLRGREDWARHYTLSAALAILENPMLSDTAGLIKEQLDTLSRGSGFSFGDLAADRAGVRFAEAATHSVADAAAMQRRLRNGFIIDDFFPPASDFPENLTTEQFRQIYGGVGSSAYRRMASEIEVRLSTCPGLSVK